MSIPSGVDIDDLWDRYDAERSLPVRNALTEIYIPVTRYQAERMIAHMPPGAADVEDLSGDGNIGLMQAVEKFDLNRGVKFYTFCIPRVRGAMLDALRKSDWVPRLIRGRKSKLDRVREEIVSKNQPVTERRLAGKMDVSIEQLRAMQREIETVPHVTSLDKTYAENDVGRALNIHDECADNTASDPPKRLSDRDDVTVALRGLDKVERLALLLYYCEGWKMKDVGINLGLSESRVSQMISGIRRFIQFRDASDRRSDSTLRDLLEEHGYPEETASNLAMRK